jgi:hypothetical protein
VIKALTRKRNTRRKPKEQKKLSSDTEQEDMDVHQVMMECYSINVYKISINKQPKEGNKNEEILSRDLTNEEENLENRDEEDETLNILKMILDWLLLLNKNKCYEKMRVIEPPKEL